MGILQEIATDIVMSIYKDEIFILLLIIIIFLASKIGFIKILLWLLNKIL